MLGTEKLKLECILTPLPCAPRTAVNNLMCHKCNLWVLFSLKYMFLALSLKCKVLQCLLQKVQNKFTKSWDPWSGFNKSLNNEFFTTGLVLYTPTKYPFLLKSVPCFIAKGSHDFAINPALLVTPIIQYNFYWVSNKYVDALIWSPCSGNTGENVNGIGVGCLAFF